MPSQKCLGYPAIALLCVFALIIEVAPARAASREKVLLSFDANDGNYPLADLIFDSAGNLYGTVARGTFHGNGGVFELIPDGKGNWTEKVLYSFHGKDGSYPASRLVFDQAGNLYGTTEAGGDEGCGSGCGTVFELSPTGAGKWTETILHIFSFDRWSEGIRPNSVILGADGDLYGTTVTGGDLNGDGLVFKLAPGQRGEWTETVLYTFAGYPDGANPLAGLIFDSLGNLYGITNSGGNDEGCESGCGTVFQMTPGTDAQWTEKIIYDSDWAGGAFLSAPLTADSDGNLYSTAPAGGDYGYGVVFELESGSWAETLLYSFPKGGPMGYPCAAVTFDKAGNLYSASFGGHNRGAVFELLRPARSGATWTNRILHVFHGEDGAQPFAGVVLDSAGNLYGTTRIGGTHACHTHGCGTVYEVTP